LSAACTLPAIASEVARVAIHFLTQVTIVSFDVSGVGVVVSTPFLKASIEKSYKIISFSIFEILLLSNLLLTP